MLIARLTYRYYFGTRPDQCRDRIEGYYTTIDKARAVVRELLGTNATDDTTFGFDVWTSSAHPHVEYLIDLVEVR